MNSRLFSLPPRLLRKYGTRDPFRLAEALGIQVRYIDTSRQKGFCVRILKQYFIFIRRDMSDQMQRICCAHELGHILLHKDYLGTAANMMNMELFDMHNHTEYEANLFAAALLIDEGELGECLRQGMDIVSTASALDVNVNLVALRLTALQRFGQAPGCPSAFPGDHMAQPVCMEPSAAYSVALPFTPDRRFLGHIADRADSL